MCKTQQKMWKNLRKNVWENGEKFSPFLLFCSVCDFTVCKAFGFHIIIRNKINMFYTWMLFGFNLLERGFTQFPHSLLLLQQNKLIYYYINKEEIWR